MYHEHDCKPKRTHKYATPLQLHRPVPHAAPVKHIHRSHVSELVNCSCTQNTLTYTRIRTRAYTMRCCVVLGLLCTTTATTTPMPTSTTTLCGASLNHRCRRSPAPFASHRLASHHHHAATHAKHRHTRWPPQPPQRLQSQHLYMTSFQHTRLVCFIHSPCHRTAVRVRELSAWQHLYRVHTYIHTRTHSHTHSLRHTHTHSPASTYAFANTH